MPRIPKVNPCLAALAALAIVAAAASSAPPGAAATCLPKDQVRQTPPASGSVVVQICSAGSPVNDVGGVDLVDPSGADNANAHLARGAVLALHTTIGAPAATVIDIESPAGVIARIYGGARLKILAQSDRSESYATQAGQTGFDVPEHRLDFMNVVTQSLLAIVKGTDFDITVTSGGTQLSVARGLVAAGRSVYVKINADNKILQCIRIMELVSAGNAVMYPTTPEVKDFADRAAALHAATGHPHGETARVMVAAVICGSEFSLAVHGTPEFPAPNHQRVIEHATLLQILDQCSRRLIHTFRL